MHNEKGADIVVINVAVMAAINVDMQNFFFKKRQRE